ncbi:cytochrome C [Paracoccus sp. (in: a-proteobacteria)]|uniref:cytochrome C n=1 Tax=Paracoccus sp. TaxID=267 RepID=UPI0026DF428E|nr:cytochrome C [Paracoccus sp. (in: a-proteobacteria)]MDO5647091.1 cytochrome C [Paracoccus sp. (in: a-proteobacteria)]
MSPTPLKSAIWASIAALLALPATAQDAPGYALPRMMQSDQISVPNAAEIDAWARSGHANFRSRSFTNWNDAGEIPPVCATCHSGQGFRALHRLDGGTGGMPDRPFPVGGVVDCATCHSPGLSEITEIALPNGQMHPVTGSQATCLTCHQGRQSGDAIARATAEGDPDQPNPDLRFMNPHYAVAAATWLGGTGALGYHYDGKTYAGQFHHAPPVATCTDCHDPHRLTVATDGCTMCHSGETNPRAIRMSRASHDGSGNLTQGIHADIANNADLLKSALHDYARQVAGVPMIYDSGRHPYFFADANDDGRVDLVDGTSVVYNAWTPRLLRGAYNWKFVTSDTGAHVHNPHYALQLLYDSIQDLTTAMGGDFDALNLSR